MISILFKSKAAINCQDHQGMTPLHYAAKNGQYAIVQLLIMQGADHSIKCSEGKTPYDYSHGDTCDILNNMRASTSSSLGAAAFLPGPAPQQGAASSALDATPTALAKPDETGEPAAKRPKGC